MTTTKSSDIPEGKTKTTLYWDRELKQRIEELAKRDDRPLNSYIMHVLKQHAASLTPFSGLRKKGY